MQLFVKIFDGRLVKVFDTAIDKKKRIVITTINDFQEEAEVEFYVKGQKVKTLLFTNLPPVKARVLNIPVTIELVDFDTLIFSYKAANKKENTIEFDISDIRERNYTKPIIIGVMIILVIGCLFGASFFLFKNFSFSQSNKNYTQIYSTTIQVSVTTIKEAADMTADLISQFENTSDLTTDYINAEGEEPPMEFTLNSFRDIVQSNTPLYFIKDKAVLKKNEIKKLDKILEYAKNYSSISLLIKGHTADIGKPNREKNLSIKRAKLIADYIKANFTNIVEIEIKGMGSQEKVICKPTKEQKWLNRRVEIIVNSVTP